MPFTVGVGEHTIFLKGFHYNANGSFIDNGLIFDIILLQMQIKQLSCKYSNNTGVQKVKTVSKALKILKILGERPMKVQEIAEKMGIHKSSASRILGTMCREGFVKVGKDKKYQLGFAVFELAHLVAESLDIREVARPYLKNLNLLTNETVHLCVLENGEVVYIDKIDSQRLVRMFSRVGKRAQPYCTGVGKAILAFLPEQELDQVLEKIKFNGYTANTITDKEHLKEELFKVRQEGIAWDREEHEKDIYCIAAPILDIKGNPVASISISITSRYTTVEILESYIEPLKEATRSISRELGYVEEYPPCYKVG